MTTFFSSTFWALTVCDIQFCIWRLSKFIFILVHSDCKIPEFWWWKLWDQNFVPFDSGNIETNESKKSGFTFSIELRSKFVWSHGLQNFVWSHGLQNFVWSHGLQNLVWSHGPPNFVKNYSLFRGSHWYKIVNRGDLLNRKQVGSLNFFFNFSWKFLIFQNICSSFYI